METPLAFHAEWFDEEATLLRTFQLLYYPKCNKIQIFEPRAHKTFLKKSTVDNVKEGDIYVGNSILIFSRRFYIKDYADDFTKSKLAKTSERTFGMLKPDSLKNVGEILEHINLSGLKIRAAKMAILNDTQAGVFYAEHTGKPFLPALIEYITSGAVLGLQLQGENAVARWRKMIGPTDPIQALAEDPTSLRARYGKDKTFNGFHGSDSLESAHREISFFFPNNPEEKSFSPQTSATFRNTTCCIVKPHAISEGLLGPILSAIQEAGFSISGLEMVRFDHASASEFLEIYDGVLFEYLDMVTQLQSGPSVVLEISGHPHLGKLNGQGEKVTTQQAFREVIGPIDPELAKKVRPKSLRARFGKTKILNALHCTDLPEDASLEVEFAFKIMKIQG